MNSRMQQTCFLVQTKMLRGHEDGGINALEPLQHDILSVGVRSGAC